MHTPRPQITARRSVEEDAAGHGTTCAGPQSGLAYGTFDAYRPLSLDTPVDDGESAATYGDLISSEDTAIEDVVDHIALRPLLDKLPERERTILLHRFYGNKTQNEIAALMGVSQMQISRLISRGLTTLHAGLLNDA